MRFYCRNQLNSESTKTLKVPGNRSLSLSVDKVFVPLTIEYGQAQSSESTQNLDLLQGSNRLLVVGDPGSGKSSLIKYLFRENCRAAERMPTKSRLPIQVELKRLGNPNTLIEKEAAEWFLREMRNRVASIEGYNMGQLFDSCLTTVGIMLLLDGLDEVSGDNYPAISAALRGLSSLLAAKSDRNAIIITMRIQYYQEIQNQLSDDFPEIAYVRPFNPNEIYTFLTKWPFVDRPQRNITRIYGDLTDRPTLRTMCSNPLVLAMYVAKDQTLATGEVPESRTDFYRSVVDELLVLRRRRQEIVRGPSRALREQREDILGELAYNNLTDAGQPANSLAWAAGLEVASRVWGISEAEAENRFRTMANDTGIFAEERYGERFQFIHLTFCEFLAAIECASSVARWRNLLDTHKGFAQSFENNLTSRLVEVIPFALALMPRPERSGALTEVAALGDREVLGRCFLETQLYDRDEWPEYVVGESEFLTVEGEHRRDESWLRRLHLFNVVLRDARIWMAQVAGRQVGPELDGLLPKIVGANKNALKEIFSLYASQDAPAAFRLAESVGVNMLNEPETLIQSCQEPPFLALAIERATEGSVDRDSWMLLLAESGLRYRNVAHTLTQTEAPKELQNIVTTNVPAPATVVRAQSFYRACLISAFSRRPGGLRPEFKVMSILAPLRTLKMRTITVIGPLIGIMLQLIAAAFLLFYVIEESNRLNGTTFSPAPNLALFIPAFICYLGSFALIFSMTYYRSLVRQLFNWERWTKSPQEDSKSIGTKNRSSSPRLGRFFAGPFVRPAQLALYKIRLIRGDVEPGGTGNRDLDADLLPPRKVRSWSQTNLCCKTVNTMK